MKSRLAMSSIQLESMSCGLTPRARRSASDSAPSASGEEVWFTLAHTCGDMGELVFGPTRFKGSAKIFSKRFLRALSTRARFAFRTLRGKILRAAWIRKIVQRGERYFLSTRKKFEAVSGAKIGGEIFLPRRYGGGVEIERSEIETEGATAPRVPLRFARAPHHPRNDGGGEDQSRHITRRSDLTS